MKTAFVQVDKAAREYFERDLDAVIERIIKADLMLFVRLPSVPARIAPWSSVVPPEEGHVSRISGFFPLASHRARWLLDGTAQTVSFSWVGFRYKSVAPFEEDDRPNSETDFRAWFVVRGESTKLTVVRANLLLSRKHLEDALIKPEPKELRPQGWPWGTYETGLLRQLAAAADRFWKNYDPTEPDTAVTKDVVVEWLQGRGVSVRTAEQIDTILRAENLPKGPRGKK